MPKTNNQKNKSLKRYTVSIIIGLLTFILSVTVFSLLTLRTPFPKDNSLTEALISVAISSFIASFYYVHKERKNGLVTGLLIGFIMLVLMFLIFVSFSAFKLNESSLLLIPACLLPACIAGIVAVNIKRK